MAKILFILMPKNFKDAEFFIPYDILTKAGHTVDVAGMQQGTSVGMDGGEFTPNMLLSDLDEAILATYDALIIPGGLGSTTYLWGNKAMQQLVRTFHEQKKLVATICYASIVPAQAGILKDKQGTVYPTDETLNILEVEGVNFVDQGTVTLVNEKIITSQGPKFAEAFSKEILTILEKA